MVMSSEPDQGEDDFGYSVAEGIKQENTLQEIAELSRKLISVRGDEDNFARVQSALRAKGYRQFRLCDRSGNCMYQAFLFGFLDRLAEDEGDFEQLLQRVAATTCKGMVEKGHGKVVIEDFVENFLLIMDKFKVNFENARENLYEAFGQDSMEYKYCVQFVRLAVSNHMQDNAEQYKWFLDEKSGFKDYCKVAEVLGEYGDEVQFSAMCTVFNMRGVIESVSKKGSEYQLVPVEFNAEKGGEFSQYMLFFNHHYDMLYK